MAKLGSMVKKVGLNHTGPLWLKIDIFCEDETGFTHVCENLQTIRVPALFWIGESMIWRFDTLHLNVIKISLLYPEIKCNAADKEIHDRSFAVLVEEMEMPLFPY